MEEKAEEPEEVIYRICRVCGKSSPLTDFRRQKKNKNSVEKIFVNNAITPVQRNIVNAIKKESAKPIGNIMKPIRKNPRKTIGNIEINIKKKPLNIIRNIAKSINRKSLALIGSTAELKRDPF